MSTEQNKEIASSSESEKEPRKEGPVALDERGFVFLDDYGRPFRCAMLSGEPWLIYWHPAHKLWVTLRKVSQSEIWSFPRNLTEEEQALYL